MIGLKFTIILFVMVAVMCSRAGNDIFVANVVTFAGDVSRKGTKMTQNKIPTNEDIIQYSSNKAKAGVMLAPHEFFWGYEDMLNMLAQASAAGREEQRERDAQIAESGVCGDSCGTAAANKLAKAIRAQGEEEK